uniref:Uncharacterized protein n=1 Tax=Aegilops tauschii subsp. strangulata TaxID=200361 RepID=A0A453BCA5_AEGTS
MLQEQQRRCVSLGFFIDSFVHALGHMNTSGPGEQRQLDPGGAPLWDPLRPNTVVTNGDDDDEDWPSIWDSGCVELEMKIGHSIHDHCSPLLFVETISVFFINDL